MPFKNGRLTVDSFVLQFILMGSLFVLSKSGGVADGADINFINVRCFIHIGIAINKLSVVWENVYARDLRRLLFPQKEDECEEPTRELLQWHYSMYDKFFILLYLKDFGNIY